MRYTRFFDMHSGGGRKTDFAVIYIEADEQAAKQLFENRFRRDPDNETCPCCGDDYSIYEVDTVNTRDMPALVIDSKGHETVLQAAP